MSKLLDMEFADIYDKFYDDIQFDIKMNDYDVIEQVKEDTPYKYQKEGYVLFNMQDYLLSILKTYKYNEIKEQYDRDAPRTGVFVDSIRVDTWSSLKRELSYLDKIKTDRGLDMFMIIGLLCCQSSYAFPYIFCNNMVADASNGIGLFNSNKNRRIDILTKNGNLRLVINGCFQIKDFNEQAIDLDTIGMTLFIDTNIKRTPKGFKVVNTDGLFVKNGVFVWS